ncbi:MAG TPA: TldD/PmbA family protein [bacterium (Candidatus Stahlbacteria)]|nr:TldD/PmbA family protein [Candidatus Stahlbacteria bacterium]
MTEKLLGIIEAPLVEVRFEESWYTSIQFRGADIDRVGTSIERGGIIRGYDGELFSTIVFNNPDQLNKFSRIKMARKRDFAIQPPLKTEIQVEKERDPRKVMLDEKISLLKRYNDIIASTKGMTSTNSLYRDQFRRRHYINNHGREIIEETAYTGIALSGIARDGMNVQVYGRTIGDQKGFNNLLGLEPIAEDVCAKTLELVRADRVSSGVYDCVIDPELSGVFIHEAFGHLAEADHLYENQELLDVMKIGRQIGCEQLSAVDDPTISLERGSYFYDDEGIEAQKTFLIKNGRIDNFLQTRETAIRLSAEPTGNGRAINYNFPPIVRMSNTYILPGDKSKDEMISSLKRGLYVKGSKGGQTALEDFIFAARIAYLIEDGRIKEPIRDVIMSGNIFTTLKNITSIGNDLTIHGGIGGCGKGGQSPLPVSDGGPHLLIKRVVIGGR